MFRSSKVDGFITGGLNYGLSSRVAYGIKFVKKVTNAVETIDCEYGEDGFLPEMNVGRSMHQSCIIQENKKRLLLVVGGKLGNQNWLKSVEAIDLTPRFIMTGLIDKQGNPLTS